MNRFQVERRVRRRPFRALALRGERRRIPAGRTRERRRVDGRGPIDAGRHFERGDDIIEKLQLSSGFGVLRWRQGELRQDQSVRGQPHVHGLELEKSARQQARRGHHGHRECDLRNDKCAAAVAGRGLG